MIPEESKLPLVGGEALATHPDAKVLIVSDNGREGLQKLLHRMVLVSWKGPVSQTDWSVLRDRNVDIWLDQGAWAKRAIAQLAPKLLKLGCAIRAVDTRELPVSFGPWDVLQEGWTVGKIREFLAPRWIVISVPPEIPPGPIGIVQPLQDRPQADPEPEPPPPPTPPEPLAPATAESERETLPEFYRRAGIKYSGDRPPLSNAANAYLALKTINKDRDLNVCFDEFLRQIVWKQPRVRLDDNDLVILQCELQDGYGLGKTNIADVQRCVQRLAKETVVNEARDWLCSLVWDGEERLPHLMADAFGAVQDDYTAAVGRCFLMSMAKRVLEPGCQQDYVVVLEGLQGQKKSSALQVIGGKWYMETHEEFGSLEFLIAIQGKVLVALGELSSFKGTKREKTKGIITRRVDTFRSKYGMWANDHPRIACFVGDTNEANYLNDPTGDRRYWPVRTTEIDLGWLKDNRDQLWAEARARLDRGERYWDVPTGLAEEAQEQRREISPWEERLLPWLKTYLKQDLSMSECLQYLGVTTRDEAAAAKVVAPILRKSGWRRMQVVRDGQREYAYRRPTWSDAPSPPLASNAEPRAAD